MSETAPTVIITNAKLDSLSKALASLDGLRTSPDSFKPYKFDDESSTIWRIAEAQTEVGAALDKLNRAKKILASQHGIAEGMKITPENAIAVNDFLIAVDRLAETEVELKLTKLTREQLKIGSGEKRNPIPPSVLSALMPILES